MIPARDNYATQDEWLRALSEWNDAVPSNDNDKMFMVFSGEITSDKFLFEGTLWEFKDSFFEAFTWLDVESWANQEGNLLIVEGTDEYDRASEMLDLAEVEEVQDDAIGGKTKFGHGISSSDWIDN